MERKSSYDLRPFSLPSLEDADSSPEQLREKVYKEAFDLGYREGYSEGKRQASSEIQRAVKSLEGILRDLEEFRKQALESLKEQILELSVAVAKKVIRRELELDRSGILEVIREAIRRVTEDDLIRIHVSPEDLDLVRRHREELLKELGESKKLVLYPDPEVSPGGCFVETEFAEVDARIETQIETLVESLKNGY